MDIFLTIDVECYSGDYEREVFGNGLGLEYILRTCSTRGVRATFFVEALGATRWGLEQTGKICDMVRKAGQEVQLHLHPVVAQLEGFEDKDDILWKYGSDVQERLITAGVHILRKCGVNDVTAMRAGDFAANRDTLTAMRKAGILISSNRDMDCKCSTRSQLNDFFPVSNDISKVSEMIDLPVSVFRSKTAFLDGPYRHLEISAVGHEEMKDVLIKMVEAGYSCATVLTHPREFFRMTGEKNAIRKNCRRLEKLLAFLKGRKDMKLRVVSECAGKTPAEKLSPVIVSPSIIHSACRIFEQGMERLVFVTGRC